MSESLGVMHLHLLLYTTCKCVFLKKDVANNENAYAYPRTILQLLLQRP